MLRRAKWKNQIEILGIKSCWFSWFTCLFFFWKFCFFFFFLNWGRFTWCKANHLKYIIQVESSAFTALCNYSLCLVLNVILIPRGGISSQRRLYPSRLAGVPQPLPSLWQSPTCFLSLWTCLFWTVPVNGITQMRPFFCFVWLFHSMMFSAADFLKNFKLVEWIGG